MIKITKFLNNKEKVFYEPIYDKIKVYFNDGETTKEVGFVMLDNFTKIVELAPSLKSKQPYGHIYFKYRSVGTAQKVLYDVYQRFKPKWYKVIFQINGFPILVYKVPYEYILFEPDRIIHDYEIQHHIIIPEEVFQLLMEKIQNKDKKLVIVIKKGNRLEIIR